MVDTLSDALPDCVGDKYDDLIESGCGTECKLLIWELRRLRRLAWAALDDIRECYAPYNQALNDLESALNE